MRRVGALVLLVGALGCVVGARGQADAAAGKLIAFDAVSVRQNKSDSNVYVDKTPKDGFAVEHYPLHGILSIAYGARWDLISGGPKWIDTNYYDITAKVAGEDLAAYRALSKAQQQAMVQAMLVERFKLATHIETKEMPGYEMVVAKNGPKLKDATEKHEGYGANRGDIFTDAIRMPTLAKLLSQQLQKVVTDKTGLTGMYAFELKWAQDMARARPEAGEGESAQAADPGPSLFTALEEQLGLKLNSTKGPVDTVVIDHVELPSEN
jgi:uncharacterized protein (TIGR03435 family)